jgi:hypothetical protein
VCLWSIAWTLKKWQRFFSIFWVSCYSKCALVVFSSCSHQVPNVFPKWFQIDPHIYPKVVLFSLTYVAGAKGKVFYLENRNFYFGETLRFSLGPKRWQTKCRNRKFFLANEAMQYAPKRPMVFSFGVGWGGLVLEFFCSQRFPSSQCVPYTFPMKPHFYPICFPQTSSPFHM